MVPENRIPTHPGVVLKQEFLVPLGISQVALAAHLRVPVQRVNELVRGKRGITAQTAWLRSALRHHRAARQPEVRALVDARATRAGPSGHGRAYGARHRRRGRPRGANLPEVWRDRGFHVLHHLLARPWHRRGGAGQPARLRGSEGFGASGLRRLTPPPHPQLASRSRAPRGRDVASRSTRAGPWRPAAGRIVNRAGSRAASARRSRRRRA